MHTDLVTAPHSGNHTIFLSGPAGSGKTTLATRRLHHLLQIGIPGEQLLILVPQRTLAGPYYLALNRSEVPAGSQVEVSTIGGLARRTLDLFWPLVASEAGFARPDRRPRFLTLETTQYHMDRIVERFVADGAFDGITIPRARLVSQIIDNVNKAATIGFPPEEISARLKSAWSGESARLRIYDQVQAVALEFRQECLQESLLDWSLQIQVFRRQLLPLPQLRRYLLGGVRHLIVDNLEEDIPATHDLLRLWLPLVESALLVYEPDGGYRVFLGADPQGALHLATLCREQVVLSESHVSSPQVAALGLGLAAPFLPALHRGRSPADSNPRLPESEVQASEALEALFRPPGTIKFHPQMLDWVAEEISRLVLEGGMPPGEIAVLAPFLSDALRFSLSDRLLSRYGIQVRTHRPSRELREEPATRCLLTLAKLAHPHWHRPPPPFDVAQALMQSIAGLDPVRAHLLTGIVYRIRDGRPALTPFHQIVPEMQNRVSFLLGERYSQLWNWLQQYIARDGGRDENGPQAPEPAPEVLDYFLSRLFGEVLAQAGFGFHGDFDAGATAATLIESVQKFRQSLVPPLLDGGGGPASPGESPGPRVQDPNLEYLDMVERGVVAAQYIASWQVRPENAVLLVPAYTFLMMNQPVSVQFWLDAGSRAWYERIYQPLTHPYVLRRDWPEGQVWTDDDEVQVREAALARLILGLTRRCRQRIYLAYSELSEQGFEQQGPLLQAVQHLLRKEMGEAP